MGVYADTYRAVHGQLAGRRDYGDFDDDWDDDYDGDEGDPDDDDGVSVLQAVHDVVASADGVYCQSNNLPGF